jgi:hypothetical protein
MEGGPRVLADVSRQQLISLLDDAIRESAGRTASSSTESWINCARNMGSLLTPPSKNSVLIWKSANCSRFKRAVVHRVRGRRRWSAGSTVEPAAPPHRRAGEVGSARHSFSYEALTVEYRRRRGGNFSLGINQQCEIRASAVGRSPPRSVAVLALGYALGTVTNALAHHIMPPTTPHHHTTGGKPCISVTPGSGTQGYVLPAHEHNRLTWRAVRSPSY